ncbi:MAG: hypothetical protein H7641_00350 [Candidatus Heimdallarchaeota archaeon]|nr:hypothetical protein [Candidatus Heimdallarchaeota archaeon]MCK4876015.1 hypothetical protein [Candidatus Heimdallarchaeota archaeon]
MRLRKSSVTIFMICVITLSTLSAGAKTTYGIWAQGGEYNFETFRVSKSNLSIKLRIHVSDGGPVSVYIMDERSFDVWGNYTVVDAYIGAKNITDTITLAGYLGPKIRRIDNETSTEMVYYLIVDNRENGYDSYIDIELIQTLPAPSVYLSLLALIPLALLISRKRKP